MEKNIVGIGFGGKQAGICKKKLWRAGISSVFVATEEDALEAIRSHNPDVVAIHVNKYGGFLHKLYKSNPEGIMVAVATTKAWMNPIYLGGKIVYPVCFSKVPLAIKQALMQ